jgi:hypothetical protein
VTNKRDRLSGIVRGGGLSSIVSTSAPPAPPESEDATLLDSPVATPQSSNVATVQRSRSWGVGAPIVLREALNVLIAKQRLQGQRITLADLVEEALIDLLRKYGEPIPVLPKKKGRGR